MPVVGQKTTRIGLPDLTVLAAQIGKKSIQSSMQSQPRQQVKQLSQSQISQLARTISIQQPIAVGGVKPIRFGSTAGV